MKLTEAEMVMEYYADIHRRLRAIRRQKADLNDEVGGLHSMNMEGMPRGSKPGDSTAALASRMEELGIGERLKVLERQEKTLRADETLIAEKLGSLNSVHNEILVKRYVFGYTWEQVKRTMWTARYSVPSLKRKRNEALAMLAEKLERVPRKDALLKRAYNAREDGRRAQRGGTKEAEKGNSE